MSEPAVIKRLGYGMTLDMDPTGGNSYVSLGGVVDGWDGSGAKKDMGDTSLLSDLFKTKAGAQIDPGEITLMIAYDPQANSSLSRLATDLRVTGPAVAAFRFTYPNTGAGNNNVTEPFIATVSSIGRTFKKANLSVAPVTLTISGDPGIANQ